MSSAERRALLLLLSLGLAGQGVRWLATRPGQPPGEVQLLTTLPARSPAAHRDSIFALERPLGPAERIDADRATPLELARLPRVGLALAKAIVADREARGPFGGAEGLDRVPGIGQGLLAAIGPHLTFSGVPRAAGLSPSGTALQGASAGAILDLNSATAVELERLPGIGAAKARAIVADRERHGSFSRVADLDRIPGFGPAAVARLSGLVRVQ
ncbi:MAG: ComEA family DNA-binding protein [Gemmatimonadales bacterium]